MVTLSNIITSNIQCLEESQQQSSIEKGLKVNIAFIWLKRICPEPNIVAIKPSVVYSWLGWVQKMWYFAPMVEPSYGGVMDNGQQQQQPGRKEGWLGQWTTTTTRKEGWLAMDGRWQRTWSWPWMAEDLELAMDGRGPGAGHGWQRTLCCGVEMLSQLRSVPTPAGWLLPPQAEGSTDAAGASVLPKLHVADPGCLGDGLLVDILPWFANKRLILKHCQKLANT